MRLRRPFPWAAVLFFSLLFQVLRWGDWSRGHRNLSAALSVFVVPFLVFGFCAWIAPAFWQWNGRQGQTPHPLRGLLQAVAGVEVWAALLVLADAGFRRGAGMQVDLGGTLFNELSITGPVTVIVSGLLAMRESMEQERQAARDQAREAQVRLLQSQLHPHALFNALNGLAELIRKDPPTAERSVLDLSDLLRQLLRASEQDTFPLVEERRMVERYLRLEGLRLAERLRVAWEWDPVLDRTAAIPMLLQPLAENAIKHGISRDPGGGELRIRGVRQGGAVLLEVWNTGRPLESGREGGIGVQNLVRRLQLAYGGAAAFSLCTEGPGTMARIRIAGLPSESPA